jgi:hypothetical protein
MTNANPQARPLQRKPGRGEREFGGPWGIVCLGFHASAPPWGIVCRGFHASSPVRGGFARVAAAAAAGEHDVLSRTPSQIL